MRRAIGWWVRIGGALVATLATPVAVRAQPAWALGDSVVLTRTATACAFRCVNYRVRITVDGAVEFVSRMRGDNGRVERATRGPAAWHAVAQGFADYAFDALPVVTVGEAPLCRVVASDGTSLVVSWFRGDAVHFRRYNMGCLGDGSSVNAASPFVLRMRMLAAHIDTVTDVASWLRR
jgi:uncharacterized Zn-binding protein involved in type VI secretion